MKRTVPLLITAIAGFVLIVAAFIPETENWGEVAGVWFDILAAIAFVLGGGSLLKIHLRKISDRAAGWGYSFVTVVAFLVTLIVGLAKFGARPAPEQEHYGETFASLRISAFPDGQYARIDGALPQKASGEKLPLSVRRQLVEENGQLVFRGWMLPNQFSDLKEFEDELRWQCTVERLFEQAQPPDPLKGKVAYYADHRALGFRGAMRDDDREALLAMSDHQRWRQAVEAIDERSRIESTVGIEKVPPRLLIPQSHAQVVNYDPAAAELTIKGPMSVELRDDLAGTYARFPLAKPLTGDDRLALLEAIESRGSSLNKDQRAVFHKVLDGVWTVEQLRTVLNEAGEPQLQGKTACEMLAEKQSGVAVIEQAKTVGELISLNAQQRALLERFAVEGELGLDALTEGLSAAGPFADRQRVALRTFFARSPTVGRRNRMLYGALLREGPLSTEQADFLLEPFRSELRWQKKVGELFVKAHAAKYPWSGNYRELGSPFWWLYEYAFKPLTATMFAMLAFYVASAAFRAFRAKNIEALLLLGTAFIILLGRTFAGVLLTSWLPESLSGLRIENLTVYIMSVFNTAGNRAIMIGIALGIASTSLKVLLGVDRSYLGGQED